MPQDTPEQSPPAFEPKGKYVVLCILALAAVVGSLFIYLGPRATSKRPGIVHVGVRYGNEATVDFMRYGKKGPGATLELIAPDGDAVYEWSNLALGRNLVPIKNIPSGPYTARISADRYESVEVPVVIEGRMLNPPEGYQSQPHRIVDYNTIGARLMPTGAQ